MRLSNCFFSTRKSVPADAELVSHQLMIRSGMIRPVASGLYAFLPVGYRVLRKITAIVEEEMNRAGAQQMLLPFVQPAGLWKESGRWDQYGEELVRFQDRKGSWFVLSPTHEEMITRIAGDILTSYRRLPVTVYQSQIKFRDEPRPRAGIIRSREFIMKDAYSFCEHEGQMRPIYEAMKQAYARVFTRCGLEYCLVEADSDLIGGDLSHEFIAFAAGGEDRVVQCTRCDYVAKLGRASSAAPQKAQAQHALAPIGKLSTPGIETIEALVAALGVAPARLLKTLLYAADEGYVAVVVQGNDQVNEEKLRRLLGADGLRLASGLEVREKMGIPVGYLGPVGLDNVPVVVDEVVLTGTDYVAGANEPGTHLEHIVPDRDLSPHLVGDVRLVKTGDACLQCGSELRVRRGLETGHLFDLGHKYSSQLQASFLDERGQSRDLLMGCYGIGISRLPAAIIEQNHDEDGIIWPQEVAPYSAVVIPVSDRTWTASFHLYEDIMQQVPDILIDDRDASAGVKFKDSDLMGIPYKIIVGNAFLREGMVEIKQRSDGEIVKVKPDAAAQKLRELIEQCKIES